MIIIAYSITTSQEVLGCVHLAPFNSSNAHGFCVVTSRSKDKTIAKHITNVQWLHFSSASPGVGESEIRARAKLGQINKTGIKPRNFWIDIFYILARYIYLDFSDLSFCPPWLGDNF